MQEDLSTYWTPPLYFMYSNGTSVMLEQEGGMLAYYLLYGDDVTEFPQGFQMIAGNPNRRNFTCQTPEPPKSDWSGYEVTQPALQQKALGFNCLNYAEAAEPSLGRHGLPTKDFIDANCPDGLRLELFFPSCWNGKDATSPDHKSHMAYPSLVNGGDCPAGYPIRTASIFFETIWNTAAFKGEDGQFVVSMGDPTGYGYHGDFMAGWQPNHLQAAINTCTNPSGEVSDCPLFTLNSDDQMGQCTFPQPSQLDNQNAAGPMNGLPGGCTVQSGPEQATPPESSDSGSSSASSSFAPASSLASASSASASLAVSSPTTQPQSAALSYSASSTGDLIMADAAITGSPSALTTQATAQSSPSPSPSSSSSDDVEAAAVPAITPVPSPAQGSTTTFTSSGILYNVLIEETTSIVTASAPASDAPARKRHVHAHEHRRRRAGFGEHY